MKRLILFLGIFFITSVCFAQGVEVAKDAGKDVYKDKTGKSYQITEIPLISTYSLKKPVIDEAKTLTKDEQDVVEFSLKENGRKLIHKEVRPIKNDYQNDVDRGTVEYTPKCRNYSFHKVVIPDGTIIKDSNFTQKEPHTKAIEGKNLTFESCNLVNVATDPSWTIKDSNTCQIKRIKKSEKDLGDAVKEIIISHQIEQKDKTFKEIDTDVETTTDADSYALAVLRLNTK